MSICENFVQLATRTEAPSNPDLMRRLTDNAREIHAFMGLLTEVGELVDAYKKHIFYGKPLDDVNVKEEVGDILWYIAILLDVGGVSFAECMEAVIAKLRVRYPEKFTEQSAIERDLVQERQTLESHFQEDTKDVGAVTEKE